jgi:hypothetical protein
MASLRAVRAPVEASSLFYPSAVPVKTEHLAADGAGKTAMKPVATNAVTASQLGPLQPWIARLG